MKDKVSLKRQSRRYKSESGKEHSSCSNNNDKLIRDGKEVCSIPLVECLCPGQSVIPDDPEQSVKMLCSNHSCPFSSKAYVHMECYKTLEEKMYILLKHSDQVFF
uniref:Headcase N-terminal domain-containing protein n=1 Tax=Panagrolaimus superbus TaxID=310955 RepID=A0A914YVJ5_9BILA